MEYDAKVVSTYAAVFGGALSLGRGADLFIIDDPHFLNKMRFPDKALDPEAYDGIKQVLDSVFNRRGYRCCNDSLV